MQENIETGSAPDVKAVRGGRHSRSVTAKYIMLFSVMLLLTNIILGVVMYNQSRTTVRGLVQKNMLSVSNTAAGLMDGELLGSFTEKDVDSPAWRDVVEELSVFQNNIDIEFIYTVRKVSADKFVFIVDPDPVNPGEIGEEVVVTDALIRAGNGVASVDVEPAQDEWGNFYSAYSPVYDRNGRITAIVGVDFDADWYEREVREHMLSAFVIIAIFLLVCLIIVFLFSRQMLGRINRLNTQLIEMTVNVDELITQLSTEEQVWIDQESGLEQASGTSQTAAPERGDEIETLSNRLKAMQEELKLYKSFAHARACTDALTGVRNTTAYIELKESLNQRIQDGTLDTDFAVIIFDINYLKKINDRYGHAAGDEVIRSAGRLIAMAFGNSVTFRVGGDEFLVLEESVSEQTIKEQLKQLDRYIGEYNVGRDASAPLSISMGYAFYDPQDDTSVREVFVRADEAMYRNKEIMHNS